MSGGFSQTEWLWHTVSKLQECTVSAESVSVNSVKTLIVHSLAVCCWQWIRSIACWICFMQMMSSYEGSVCTDVGCERGNMMCGTESWLTLHRAEFRCSHAYVWVCKKLCIGGRRINMQNLQSYLNCSWSVWYLGVVQKCWAWDDAVWVRGWDVDGGCLTRNLEDSVKEKLWRFLPVEMCCLGTNWRLIKIQMATGKPRYTQKMTYKCSACARVLFGWCIRQCHIHGMFYFSPQILDSSTFQACTDVLSKWVLPGHEMCAANCYDYKTKV